MCAICPNICLGVLMQSYILQRFRTIQWEPNLRALLRISTTERASTSQTRLSGRASHTSYLHRAVAYTASHPEPLERRVTLSTLKRLTPDQRSTPRSLSPISD